MPHTRIRISFHLSLVLLFSCTNAAADTLAARDHVVATVHPVASDAGEAAFAEGGNAIDAAVTAALTLGVVNGYNSGIGGGCLILIRTEDGRLVAIDGREEAPAAASRDMFVIDGRADPTASQTGPLAVGVPGALAAYAKALDECGTLSLSRALQPGIVAAREGCRVDEPMARTLEKHHRALAQFEGTKEVYFKEDGSVHATGELLVQKDLAHTMEQVSRQGVQWFYRGAFAKRVARWMEQNGGILTADDFARYQAVVREPVTSTYRGHTIVGFPPPSSGGVHVAQALNMLEGYDLAAMHRESPIKTMHLIAEVFNRVFADRAHWLGDSDHVDVPRGLLDKAYARQLAKTIDLNRATPVETHGTPPEWKQDLFGRHTTHVAAADARGNWVAITATINTSFGSKVIVPGTGVVLNNEMDDFSIHTGVPNAFGLIGAENNAVEPGKRPLSSMSPTIVLNEAGEPQLTIGAAGGPKIITQVLLGIIRYIEFGETLERSVASARIHHQWRPNQLGLEASAPRKWADALVQMGHKIRTLPSAGVTQAIARGKNGQLIGVADPRVPGKVSGR